MDVKTDSSPYVLIEDTPALEEFMKKLSACPVVAADIESNSLHRYVERVSLIQLTGRETDGTLHHAIVDPMSDVDVSLLGPVFADPDVVVIFHGADYDVVSLKRDYGFSFTGIYDTMIAARGAGFERFGLADLVNRYFQVTLDKRYQKHDWSARPIDRRALDYAHQDTCYLPEIMDLLREEVARHGREDLVEEECMLIEEREWTPRPPDNNAFLRMKGAARLPEENQKVLRELYNLRDQIARKKDWPAFKVMGNELLLDIARAVPEDARTLEQAAGNRTRVVRRYGPSLLDAVAAGKLSKEPIPRPKPAGGKRFSREDDALFNHLRNWRNAHARAEGVEPAMVVNNQALQEIAAARPTSASEMEKVPGVRRWQLRRYAEPLAQAVAEFQAGENGG